MRVKPSQLKAPTIVLHVTFCDECADIKVCGLVLLQGRNSGFFLSATGFENCRISTVNRSADEQSCGRRDVHSSGESWIESRFRPILPTLPQTSLVESGGVESIN